MLYAVTEIAAFMVGATIVGFLLGRITKRSAPKIKAGGDVANLASAQATVRELESERVSLRNQLSDAKERSRQLASETTAAEVSKDFAQERHKLEEALEQASAQADRLRATIAGRDTRIAAMAAGETPPEPDPANGPVGYSSSAGTFAETRIVFGEEDET